jgi:hypothetical protein
VNELADVVTVGNQEYEEVIEEYEEILVPQEFPEPPVTDFADTAPDQGKPRCITLIFDKYDIYTCCAFMLQELCEIHMHIYIIL